MPPTPIRIASNEVDLSNRFQATTTVVASPAAAAETIIASLTAANFGDLTLATGVFLYGWAAYTVGTSGTAVTFRIRQTNISGTVVVNSGALTGSQHGAGILSADDVNGLDAGAGVATYVLTMQVTAGAAASTVSATFLQATFV